MSQNELMDRNLVVFKKTEIRFIIAKNLINWFSVEDLTKALDKIPQDGLNPEYMEQKSNIPSKKYPKGQENDMYLNEPGMYHLVMKLKHPKKFDQWVSDIISSLVSYDQNKLREKYAKKLDKMGRRVSYLEKHNRCLMERKETGIQIGVICVLDYTHREDNLFRMSVLYDYNSNGMKINDIHPLKKKPVVCFHESCHPKELWKIIKGMIKFYSYGFEKGYYQCPLETIGEAIQNAQNLLNFGLVASAL